MKQKPNHPFGAGGRRRPAMEEAPMLSQRERDQAELDLEFDEAKKMPDEKPATSEPKVPAD